MSARADAHIRAQARLRDLTATATERIWRELPAYDEANLDEWLTRTLPIVVLAQRQSVTLTDAFLAQSVGRAPLTPDPAPLTGAGVRAGTAPGEVYRRPFVTVWTALKNGAELDAAIAAGLARATSTAATDVQLAMRATLREIGEADDLILGYQRVPDARACDFCRLVAGMRYRTSELLPVHNRCGCGVDVITGPERPDFHGRYDNDIAATNGDGLAAAVREHGELGPVLVDAAHDFTAQADL